MQLTRIAQAVLLTLFASHASAATMESTREQIAAQARQLEPELLETAATYTPTGTGQHGKTHLGMVANN